MNLKELKKLVSSGESERVEFKKTTGQRTDGAKTVCAMLNGMGGFVVFGVTNSGEIKGQSVTSGTLEDIAEEIRRIEPPAFPDIETVMLKDDNGVIIIRVPGGGGPYLYDGRAYSRIGASTVRMPQKHYERLLLERMHASSRWENQPVQSFNITDLDIVEIHRTIEEAVRRNRLEEPGTREPLELLRGMGLIDTQGRLLNAAVVLFSRKDRVLPDLPQCLIKMARFKGIDKTEFIDNRQEYGNAFELFQRAQRFFIDHIPVAGRIVPGQMERVDTPLYPIQALREALVNAICHRDYSVPGGSTSIAIYDDRLEISNTGHLPFDITPENIFLPHASRPWNPLVAQAFYRRGIIEAWGRGTIKMKNLTVEAGLPEPQISCQSGEVTVRFTLQPSVSDVTIHGSTIDTITHKTGQTDKALLLTHKRLVMEVLQNLEKEPSSIAQISGILGQKRPSGTLKAVFKRLMDEDFIALTIPETPRSRYQRYCLTDKGRKALANGDS